MKHNNKLLKDNKPTHSTLHTEPYFNGYPIQDKYQPLIVNNLLVHEKVLMKALSHHKRTSAFRFELKFPRNKQYIVNHAISKFFDSLRVRIKSDIANKNKRLDKKYECKLSYVWVCEYSTSINWHFHVVIFLNRDVYNCFGRLKANEGNMYSRIRAAWASAIGVSFDAALGLVHLPDNDVYDVNTNADNYEQQLEDILYRLSYFAKVQTKPYGQGGDNRFFGYSSL
ncbi:inovirus Gp2 family protein [Colwellia psychrerythraea]|uniref:YagK/YfjJ C-terminal domain-containing protein n=1 Tax=Colwellia psychrerythraea (strain 34H / ATCC BAA-681) TaxID=167879 RepID=Q47ZW5_COLP3|nr:inovirus Gp2 family protein [Colwellia psychrerythraea]AAZ27404.1 hypothetical protein CPS_2954 [Colwellia psychrerythraea 34H]